MVEVVEDFSVAEGGAEVAEVEEVQFILHLSVLHLGGLMQCP